MSASRFVRGSSLLIAIWLVITFLSDVPVKGYPKLDRKPMTVKVETAKPALEAEHVAVR